MAPHPPVEKAKSIKSTKSIPGKFKGFGKEVKSLIKDLRSDRKSEDHLVVSEKSPDALAELSRSPTAVSSTTTAAASFPASSPISAPAPAPVPAPAPAPTASPAPAPAPATTPLYTANLNIQVSLRFDEPLDFSYSRSYAGSPSLVVSERLCQALLHRVDHCAQELITRRDSSALQRTRGDGGGKPVRFEMHVRINRGADAWAVRTFASYQKLPLTAEAAREVALEAHYMIGLFLRRHDDGFVLKDGPIRDDTSQPPETHPFRAGRVQPMSCVPRTYFLGKAQDFESIPGYTLKLQITSRHARRKPAQWQSTVEVHSQQMTPLNLAVAESAFFDASHRLEAILRAERESFEERHRNCSQPDGCSYYRQHEGDGFEIVLEIRNNAGPQFEHLQRMVASKVALLSHMEGLACDKFVDDLQAAFKAIRTSADDKMNSMNDLEFRIIELRGRGWTLDEPLLFTVGPAETHSRRSTGAILDRIQTSIADILRRNAISVRMTAYKRGHFVLDKTLVAREPLDPLDGKKRRQQPKTSKEQVLERLIARVRKDIEIMCADTCTLEDNVFIPVGTAPRCLPAYEDGAMDTLVSPSRASGEFPPEPDSEIRPGADAAVQRTRAEESSMPPPNTPPPPVPQRSSTYQESLAIFAPLDAPIEVVPKIDDPASKSSTGDDSLHPGPYLPKGRTPWPKLDTDVGGGDGGPSSAQTAPSLVFADLPTPRGSHEVSPHARATSLDIQGVFSSPAGRDSSEEEGGRGGGKFGKSSRPSSLWKIKLSSLGRRSNKSISKGPSPLQQGQTAASSDANLAEAPEKKAYQDNSSFSEKEGANRLDTSTPNPKSNTAPASQDVFTEKMVYPAPTPGPTPVPVPKRKPTPKPNDGGATATITDVSQIPSFTIPEINVETAASVRALPDDSVSDYEAALRSLETDEFSQSRLDFDFSSPSVASPVNSPADKGSPSKDSPAPHTSMSPLLAALRSTPIRRKVTKTTTEKQDQQTKSKKPTTPTTPTKVPEAKKTTATAAAANTKKSTSKSAEQPSRSPLEYLLRRQHSPSASSTSPSPSSSSPTPPSPPQPPPVEDRLTQRRSFGSAGILGFSDPRFVQLSMRRALMPGAVTGAMAGAGAVAGARGSVSAPTSPSKALLGMGGGKIGNIFRAAGGSSPFSSDAGSRRPRTVR